MSNSKHTPGPWHCDGSAYKSTGARVYKQWGNAGNQQLIADASAHDENAEECKANARLIAAAPDLLSTLEHIVEYWNRSENNTAMADALNHILEVAEAAIAKSGASA